VHEGKAPKVRTFTSNCTLTLTSSFSMQNSFLIKESRSILNFQVTWQKICQLFIFEKQTFVVVQPGITLYYDKSCTARQYQNNNKTKAQKVQTFSSVNNK
jgi:hypothetical protein